MAEADVNIFANSQELRYFISFSGIEKLSILSSRNRDLYEMKQTKILPARLIVLFIFLSFSCFNSFCLAANVTYDHRSLLIDGRRKLFLSASIHYPRSVPAVSHHSSSLSVFFFFFFS